MTPIAAFNSKRASRPISTCGKPFGANSGANTVIDERRPDDLVLEEAQRLSRLELVEFIRNHVDTLRERMIRGAQRDKVKADVKLLKGVASCLEKKSHFGVEHLEVADLFLRVREKLKSWDAWD